MKKFLLQSIVLVLFFNTAVAQKYVDGSAIALAAKRGENITYEGVTINGMLDFTNYSKEKDNLSQRTWRWWGIAGNKKDETSIRGKIVFKNCTFNDEVIAYIVANNDYLFTASFEQEVVFENCVFKADAAFKYSDFNKNVTFAGSSFQEEANFKYAKFYKDADFSNINAKQDANFKYAKFSKAANFSAAAIRTEANFKYAEFNNGLNLADANINGLLNFKYTQIEGELETKGMSAAQIDTKYTKLNGASFSNYFLTSRD
ncbi:MAG TPA: pentapeptide repeat-containing protein [Cyclobacteriaceae bacterium]|nr:pentapeptide repeat-containing protein [Cyclobacteriaceae bacterium]